MQTPEVLSLWQRTLSGFLEALTNTFEDHYPVSCFAFFFLIFDYQRSLLRDSVEHKNAQELMLDAIFQHNKGAVN